LAQLQGMGGEDSQHVAGKNVGYSGLDFISIEI
jgi:hypothetical protein